MNEAPLWVHSTLARSLLPASTMPTNDYLELAERSFGTKMGRRRTGDAEFLFEAHTIIAGTRTDYVVHVGADMNGRAYYADVYVAGTLHMSISP